MPIKVKDTKKLKEMKEQLQGVIRFQPFGPGLDLFHCQDDEVLIAGPAGTGKSISCLQKLHLAMSKYPDARGFMARKTRVSMTNSCLETFQKKVLKPADK